MKGVCEPCGVAHGSSPCPRLDSKPKRLVNPGASQDGVSTGSVLPHNQPTITNKAIHVPVKSVSNELLAAYEEAIITLEKIASAERAENREGSALKAQEILRNAIAKVTRS